MTSDEVGEADAGAPRICSNRQLKKKGSPRERISEAPKDGSRGGLVLWRRTPLDRVQTSRAWPVLLVEVCHNMGFRTCERAIFVDPKEARARDCREGALLIGAPPGSIPQSSGFHTPFAGRKAISAPEAG